MVLPLLFAACSEDGTNDYSDPDTGYDPDADPCAISINASLNSFRTRADGNTIDGKWNDETAFSVFMQPKGGNLIQGTYSVKPGTIENEGVYASFEGDLKWEEANQQYGFYALYPVLSNVTDVTKVPVEVPAVQNQTGRSSDHVTALDYNLAAPVVTSSPGLINDPTLNTPVEFAFSHLFSLHEYRITMKGNDTRIKVNKITVKDVDSKPLAISGSTVDMTTFASSDKFAAINGGTATDEITINVTDGEFLQTSASNAFPVSFIVLPSDHTSAIPEGEEELAKNILVTIEATVDTIDEDGLVTETEEETFEVELVGDNYKRGYKYVTSIVIGGESGGIGDPGVPWDGTSTKPAITDTNITLTSASELAWIGGIVNGNITDDAITDATLAGYTITMTQNINLGELEWTPIGSLTTKPFSGTLEGGGKHVTGLKIKDYALSTTARYVGLFGAIKSATINDLHVTGDIDITTTLTGPHTGGISAYSTGTSAARCSISNCSFSGSISITAQAGTNIGGIIGNPNYTDITMCENYADMTFKNNNSSATSAFAIGGIAGTGSSADILNCSNYGNFTAVLGALRIGGIYGYQSGGNVKGCRNMGNISGLGLGSSFGGIAGYMSATMVACYNTGNIELTGSVSSGNYYGVGGIAGTCGSNKVLKGCYTTGTITTNGHEETMVGNAIGRFYAGLSAFNYTQIANNYYNVAGFGSDLDSNVTQDNRITRFASGAWPTASMDGWGTGQGEDDKYWGNLGSFGGAYPTLWWE